MSLVVKTVVRGARAETPSLARVFERALAFERPELVVSRPTVPSPRDFITVEPRRMREEGVVTIQPISQRVTPPAPITIQPAPAQPPQVFRTLPIETQPRRIPKRPEDVFRMFREAQKIVERQVERVVQPQLIVVQQPQPQPQQQRETQPIVLIQQPATPPIIPTMFPVQRREERRSILGGLDIQTLLPIAVLIIILIIMVLRR